MKRIAMMMLAVMLAAGCNNAAEKPTKSETVENAQQKNVEQKAQKQNVEKKSKSPAGAAKSSGRLDFSKLPVPKAMTTAMDAKHQA
ncbi:MAG: hypothetical protein K8S55_11470, partial [Phycisphaerae bacterium]|nr:hypothetical protein [Phycisphaerae bacterium]